MKQFVFFLLASLISGLQINAQDCRFQLSGYILDRATKEPLAYSTIGIIELGRGTAADSLGYFVIRDLCAGAYHLQVDHIGCTSIKRFISLRGDSLINIFLEHHDELLREVIVEGSSVDQDASQSRQVISSGMIKDHAGETLSDITSIVSGVTMLSNGAGITKPVIHGLYGNRVAVINNGLFQAGQQWGADHAPEIDPNSAGIITVVKGSDAIEYGAQALGGAVIIDAGPLVIDPHTHGTFGYAFDMNGYGHTLYGKATRSFEKIDLRWTGTVRKAGDKKAPDYFLTNTGSAEINGSLQLNYRVNGRIQHQWLYSIFNTRLGVFAGSHISNLTDLQQAIGREIPFNLKDGFSYAIHAPYQRVAHHLVKYAGKNFITDESFIEWTYGLQYNHRKEFDIRRGNRTGLPALDLQLWAHSGEIKYVNELHAVKYKIGWQGRWIDNSNDADTGILPLIPDYREGNGAFFINARLPFDKWIIETGARYDLQLVNVWSITHTLPREIIRYDHTYHDAALAGGLVWMQGDESSTRLHNMVVFRSPEVNELYSNGLHQGIAGIEEGDPALQKETSFKSILTQSFHLHDLLHFELTVYAHLINEYIYLKPQDELRLTIRGAFPVYTYEQDDVFLRGMDASFIADVSEQLEWAGKISLIKGTLRNGKGLSLIPPTFAATSVSWSLKDTGNWKRTRLKLEGAYTARQRNWDEVSEILAPPGEYFLWNAEFETGLQWGANLVHFGLYAENLLNTSYRNYLNRLRYFADEQGRNVRVNIRYEF